MKRLLCLLLIFTFAIPAFAEIVISGHAPTVSGPGADDLNKQINNVFNDAIEQLQDELKVFQGPNKFLRAMGDASVYGSQGATTRGYGGYNLFTATIGPVIGVQLPKNINAVVKDLSSGDNNIIQSLKDDGDIQAGINPNFFNVHIGLNMGFAKSLPEKIGFLKRDNLYLGFRFGYFRLPELNLGNDFKINYSNLTLGLTANYQLIPSYKVPILFLWRGVNLGTGLLYNRSRMGFGIAVDDISKEIDPDIGDLVLQSPTASINLTTNTFIIPLEAVTAIKFLIFNIPAGIGADIAFGKTSLGANVTGDVDVKLNGTSSSLYTKDKKGDITATGSLSHAPSFFNFKLMTGLGIHAGPVVFDIPVTFYPANSGYTIGLTIGAVY